MADIKKIRLSGVTYNIVDDGALHTLDNSVTSGGTNAVKGSGIYDAITASSAAVLETVGQAGYQTSADVQNAISGKADSSAVTEEISAATSGKANSSDVVTDVSKNSDSFGIGLNVTKGGSTSSITLVRPSSGLTWNNSESKLSVDTTVIAQKSDIPAVSGYADAVQYNSNSKYMEFYHGGTGGTKVYEFDASPFLIDGMVDNVEIKDVTISGESVTCLVITFNTDAGKQEIDIPLTEIFDASNYYTKSEVNDEIEAAVSGKADSTAVTQEISAAVSGKVDTSTFETYSGNVETALSGKQATLVSGTNIKTINGESVLGSGNIEIEQGTVDQTIISGSTNAVAGGAVYDGLAGKQATLVSGTNIKTVGTNSLLGSGNIALMTASIGTGNDSETLIFDFA